MTVRLEAGDCLEVMRRLITEGITVQAIVTDPPYHLTANKKGGSGVKSINLDSPYGRSRIGTGNGAGGFMGKAWDGGDIAFRPETWRLAFALLPPGGHLLAFSGTRTYHRMACAIEDAGFEIRDQLAWVYGSGFPKSHNLDGEWEGWGTALKPAWEPIVLARKPLDGTVAASMAEHRVGAINVAACRVGDEVRHAAFTSLAPCHGNRLGEAGTAEARRGTQSEPKEYIGRWPANIVHDGSEEVLAAFPQAPGQLADASTNPDTRKTQNVYGEMRRGRAGEPSADSDNNGVVGFKPKPGARRLDSGSAARFFYCAKAGKKDRINSKHPTVKPVALMQWLVRMVTPPGGTVLDPFAGTGTTGAAAMAEGFNAIMIEREEEYLADIRRRLGLQQLPNIEDLL